MLSAILAVEESSLRIKPFGQDWQTVKLSRGDLLVFRCVSRFPRSLTLSTDDRSFHPFVTGATCATTAWVMTR